MKNIIAKILLLGVVFSPVMPVIASVPEEERSQIAQKFSDGCAIEKTTRGYTVQDGAETLDFDLTKTAKFENESGEVVREYTGLATDGRTDRSWAEATLAPQGKSQAHFHKKGTEYYYITTGHAEAVATVDGAEHPLLTGTLLTIHPSQCHQIDNRSLTEKLVLLVKCAPSWEFSDFNPVHKN